MSNKENLSSKSGKPKFNLYWIYGLMGALLVVLLATSFFGGEESKRISEGEFWDMVKDGHVEKVDIIEDKRIANVYLAEDAFELKDSDGEPLYESNEGTFQFMGASKSPQFVIPVATNDKFDEKRTAFYADNPSLNQSKLEINYTKSPDYSFAFYIILPIILIVFWIFIMRRMSGGAGGAGGQIFNIGKSKAALFDGGASVSVTFNDVAGLDEAKEEVMEIVDFLKSPKKYTKLGGKIPKGALLVGPPGTGKTLLAKAMAGEAKVPFFSISGSDFVEMFVGVGASRVRDLFKQAREKAPCIVFIDEIDAIGRARGKSVMQSNDERENTLNQLLVEMDGFSSEKGVILLAATNRPDVLDTALLRPGRFDRQIGIDRPDLKGREAIFDVHLKSIKVSKDIKPEKLASQTPGFVGADIANICNEAALIAARHDKSSVDMDDFNDAIDRSIGGLEKKSKIILPEEKEIIAYHEAGHAICGWFLEHAHPLVKVSIVPRGTAALGYAQYLPKEKYIQRTEEMLDRMCMTMGGRAAEKITFNKISTGAMSDLETVTKSAYAMVAVYGMSEKVGNVSFYQMMNENNFQKPYSDETAQLIDDEAREIVEKQYKRAQELLNERKDELKIIAEELLKKEVIFKDDLEKLIGPRPHEKKVIPINKEEEKPEEEEDNSSLSTGEQNA